jgi:hypothetical protein
LEGAVSKPNIDHRVEGALTIQRERWDDIEHLALTVVQHPRTCVRSKARATQRQHTWQEHVT